MSCLEIDNATMKQKMMWPFLCIANYLSNFCLHYHSWQGDCWFVPWQHLEHRSTLLVEELALALVFFSMSGTFLTVEWIQSLCSKCTLPPWAHWSFLDNEIRQTGLRLRYISFLSSKCFLLYMMNVDFFTLTNWAKLMSRSYIIIEFFPEVWWCS
jgi:hypothetical protein